jgi:hypothetical protein
MILLHESETIQIVGYDNYDIFPHLNFIFSSKKCFIIWRII